MAGDLVAHDVDLLAHLGGERIVEPPGRFVHDHRERRLERVGEVADMGARALDDLAIGVDERVGLARKRPDLDRERAFEPFRGTGADRRQRRGDALERRQPEAHLEHGGEQQHGGKDAEGDGERPIERASLLFDLGGITRQRNQEAAFIAEIDRAFDDAQLLVLRTGRIALPRAAGARPTPWSWRCGKPPSHNERDERISGFAVSSRVTCQYQPESGNSNNGSPSDWGNLSPLSSGDATSATRVRR